MICDMFGVFNLQIPYFEFEASSDKDLFVLTKLKEEKGAQLGLDSD